MIINILCIDGGGVRGYMSAKILSAIENMMKKSLADSFNYFSGVSAGSIITLGLLKGYSAQDTVKLFRDLSPKIFYSPLSYRIKSGGGIFDSIYPDTYIEQELVNIFGTWSSTEVPKDFLITSYDLNRNNPLYFSRDSREMYISDIIRCSTAAPVYFPPKKITIDNLDILAIDGGVITNNPSTIALVHAINKYGGNNTFNILSIGTGVYQKSFINKAPTGLISWSTNILDTMFSASMANSVNEIELLQNSLLSRVKGVEKFDRIEWNLDQYIKLDDVNSFDKMDQIVDSWIYQNQNILQGIANFYSN